MPKYHQAMPKISEIDAVIIRYADTLSAEAISFKLEGILTPAQVVQRRDQLLTVPDKLTAIQQDQLVTLKMRMLIAELEEMPRTTRNAEVILSGLNSVAARLDKRESANEADLKKHYAFEGSALLEAVSIALAHLRGRATAGAALTEAEWDAALESAMHYAAMEINKNDAFAPVEELAPLPPLSIEPKKPAA